MTYETAADRLGNLVAELVAELKADGYAKAESAVAGMCYRQIIHLTGDINEVARSARKPKNGRSRR